MTHPGQRYFEQPLPDTNTPSTERPPRTERPPPRKQPKFHEVYGSRAHRKFQPEGPGYFRRNTRGRGGANRGFQYDRSRNMSRHDRDSRELGHEYNEPEQQLIDPGMKRPAFQPIDFDGRRKRKRVRGGRIKRFKRVDEFKGDTYCEVCERGFRDVNAKVLHDRSKEHRQHIGYKRTEQAEREQTVDHVNIASTHQVSESDRRTNIREGTLALLNSKALPRDFKEWVERSLSAARQAASEANDPSLLQAVQREVIQVHKVNDENCTLRRTCWTRREEATGSRYRDSSLASSSLPVIKDSELLAKDKIEASKKEESYAGQQKSVALSYEKAPRKTHAEAVDVQHKAVPVEVVDEAPPLPPSIIHQPPSNEAEVAGTTFARNTPLPTANRRPYHEVKLKWRLSKAAQAMLSCCRTEYKDVVLANYHDKFGNEMKPDEVSAKEQADVNPKESLISTYREVRGQFESEEYVYEDLIDRMSKLAKQLRDDKGRVLQLRDVLQMQTKIALQAGEFRHCHQPCSAFVRTFSSPLSVQGTNINMVGQWFVSILLKGRSGSRRGFPALLEVAQEMRSFPVGAIEDLWVHESIQAFRFVLGHNWCGFFKRTIENCQESPLSQILEGFIPFMREKALVMMTVMRKKEGLDVKENLPPYVPLTIFQSHLAWDSPEDVEASVEEVKEFVASLQHPFEIGPDGKGRESIQWRGSCEEELALSKDIDVREEMLYTWSKVRVLEEDEG